MKKNVNFGGKIASATGYVKQFQNILNYPIRNAMLPAYVKSYTPYPSLGNYIKDFNNYDRILVKSSIPPTSQIP
jgi:hypothetical protein